MITRSNWQEKWESLPVKSDTPTTAIVTLGAPALSSLGKNAVGGLMGITILKAKISEVVEFYGAGWVPGQINKCAELMYEKYYWFTVCELKQFLLRLMGGDYVSNKNLTPPVFMQFADEYAAEMLGVRYRHFSEQKPKRQFVILFESLNITDRQRAAFRSLCARDAQVREANMKRITQVAESIQMFSRKIEAEGVAHELRVKNMEKLQRQQQMRDTIELAMMAGYAPDRAIYQKYLYTLEKIKELEKLI